MNDAARILREHLRDDPNCVEALTSLGAILSDQGMHQDAVKVLRQAESLGSTDGNTYYNLGAALMNLDAVGRREALPCFAKAAALQSKTTTLMAYFDPHGH